MDGQLAESVTPVNAKRRSSRHHEPLLAAFVAGATVGEAARQAGVSERTAQRWKANNADEVIATRRGMLDGLLDRVRNALPAALHRLETIAKDSQDEAVAVRASLGIWDIFGRVSDRMQLEERLSALEGAAHEREMHNGKGN
jgi:hypothetical protein